MLGETTTVAASRCPRFTVAFALALAGCGSSLGDGARADESTSAATESGSTTSVDSTTSGSTSSSTAAESSGTTMGGDTPGLELPLGCECLEEFGCDCYEYFSACYNLDEPCEAPTPCPTVGESNPDAAVCVLELLRDRTFARFSYCHECGGQYSYEGHFYILGTDYGIDFECEYSDLAHDETIQYYALETPEYFTACLAMEDSSSQRSCLFGGFEPRESVDSCRG